MVEVVNLQQQIGKLGFGDKKDRMAAASAQTAANDRARSTSNASPSLPSSARSPRSPDTASPIYPDRAIRPLPRSRLKSRLSPEVVSTIQYPPDPPPIASPLLQETRLAAANDGRGAVNGVRGYHGHPADGHHHGHVHGRGYVEEEVGHCTCDHNHGGESGDEIEGEEVEFDHPDYRYNPATPTPQTAASVGHVHGGHGVNAIKDNVQRRLMEASKHSATGKLPPPPGSTASSADGYESFENTSNKKKRKIPLSTAGSGLGAHHQSSLSAEISHLAISGQSDGADDGGPVGVQSMPHQQQTYAQGAAASGTGISGAGRGRYGRQEYGRNGMRRPLGTASGNGYGNVRGAVGQVGKGAPPNAQNTNGIISQAIANAQEAGPLTPSKSKSSSQSSSKESVVPSSAATATSAPTSAATTPNPSGRGKTQFTFQSPSETAERMVRQEEAAATAYAQAAQQAYNQSAQAYAQGQGQVPPRPGAYPVSAQGGAGGVPLPGRGAANGGRVAAGTQTNQRLPPQQAGQRPPPLPAASGQAAANSAAAPPPPPKPKPRRRPSKEYALAARQRQLQQEYYNYHHRPTKDSMWICEFCEYEDIFGVPPLALIRGYEIRDREERKKAAEKRRLLEKARAKGRKGKKGKGKNNANNPNAANNNAAAPATGAGGAGGQNYDSNSLPPEGEEGEYYDDEEYGDEYEPVGPEGEAQYDDAAYDDRYYAPPPAPAGTPAVQTPAAGGGGPLA